MPINQNKAFCSSPGLNNVVFYTVFLIAAAIKEKVEEREGVEVLFGCRYTIYKPGGQKNNFNQYGLVSQS